MTKLLGLAFIASTAFLTACADSGDDFGDAAAELSGIYKISTYTRNDTACAPGGGSLLEPTSDGYLVTLEQELFGTPILTLFSCESPSDCRLKANKAAAGELSSSDFAFQMNETEGDALVGHGASSGVFQNGKCIGGSALDTKLTRNGVALTIEQKETPAGAFDAEDGICWTDAAREHAEGNSCTAMEQLTAELVEAL